jgi:N-acetyl-anhydromuramyl-L-alanine amidase AmpD
MLGIDGNNWGVGIELEGPPSSLRSVAWNQTQIELLWQFCLWLKNKYQTIVGVTDHSTILPTMKTDVLGGVGVDLFPWNIPIPDLMDLSTIEIRQAVRKHFNMKN